MISKQEIDAVMLNALVVDDETVICEGLKAIIDWDQYGFNVPDVSDNAYTALSMVDNRHYDLIITDIRMPGMDGLEFIKELISKEPEHNVVIMSGYKDFEYAYKAIKFGVLQYLLKPVNEYELISIIMKIRDKRLKYYKTFQKASDLTQNTEAIFLDMLQLDYNLVKSEIDDLVDSIVSSGIPDDARAGAVAVVIREIMQKASNSGLDVLDLFGNDCDVEEYLYTSDTNVLKKRFKRICLRIMDCLEKRQNEEIPVYIIEVKEYIEENFSSSISVKSLASFFYFNTAYLGRKYKEFTGISINEHLHKCRIECAKKMILNRQVELSDIPLEVGYKNPDLYYKYFKKNTGMNPTQYRTRYIGNLNSIKI